MAGLLCPFREEIIGATILDLDLGYTQFTLDNPGEYVTDCALCVGGPCKCIGCSACVKCTRDVMCAFFDNSSIPGIFDREVLRLLCATSLREWRAGRGANGGLFVKSHVEEIGGVVAEYFVFDEETLARRLCSERPPFALAPTAFVDTTSCDGGNQVEQTGDTFLLLNDGTSLGMFDIHLGRVFVVEGSNGNSARCLARKIYKELLPALRCNTRQLEIVQRTPTVEGDPVAVFQMLSKRATADMAFLSTFATVGPAILEKWPVRLHDAGDVHQAIGAYAVLKKFIGDQLRSGVCVPQWVAPSLFFVLHQLRYSLLIHKFVSLCVEEKRIWASMDDAEFENQLRVCLPEIMREIGEVQDNFWCDPRPVC